MLTIIFTKYNTKIILIITLILLSLVIVFGCKNMWGSNKKQFPLPPNKTNQTMRLPFQEIDSTGLIPESIPAQMVIFRDQESWEMFWEKYGKEAVPQIDFTKYLVIGVFLGPKPNPGYGVEITQIQKVDSQIVLKVTEYTSNPRYVYPGVIVYPYRIVSFSKTDGEIVFTVEQKFRDEQ